ncbi:lipocalin-like domain protein [Caballeronia mineralivorans PML1(12)]|uniref:Lipocalin-like domain protein n=2 Tax=Caballeronia mineralivorans TaxID=2010198 RepID=A0A0J1FRL6_9BURK|nr:lipocalin-like domain protein [Caballeronia mineralivorans PML1(12)]
MMRGTGRVVPVLATVVWALLSGSSACAAGAQTLSLRGTWVMTAAYEVTANGTRTMNFGEHPEGLLMVDQEGRYSLQIFRPNRPKFASGDKTRGTPGEYREAVLGSSTHTGNVVIDPVRNKLIFRIDTASYPNWEGDEQVRDYTYKDNILTYSVPASASGNGTVAYSVWRHMPE